MIERQTLTEVASSVMNRAKGDHAAATRMLLAAVMMDSALLAELLGMDREQVREKCAEFLRGRASLSDDDRRRMVDRSAPAPSDSSRPSLSFNESRNDHDRPAAPSMSSGGVSHGANDSRNTFDHPTASAPMRMGGASLLSGEGRRCHDRPAQPAPIRKISSAAALSVARSVFEDRIHATTDIRWGDITPRDYANLRIRNAFTREIEAKLEPIIRRAPTMETALREFADPTEVEAVRAAAIAARDSAVDAVKELINAR